jgi:5'(3')-deoxyribonucleotidase
MAKKDFNDNEPEILIFLDMDGVLTDFDRHVQETGMIREDGHPDYKSMGDEDWFVTMPAFEGAREFYDALKERGRVRFLTTPITYPECFSGKAKWILDFLSARSNWILKSLMLADDKELISAPGRFLVDDRQTNIDKWNNPSENIQGGIGIQHSGDYEETLKKLDAAIEAYKNELKPNAAPPVTEPPPQP